MPQFPLQRQCPLRGGWGEGFIGMEEMSSRRTKTSLGRSWALFLLHCTICSYAELCRGSLQVCWDEEMALIPHWLSTPRQSGVKK